MDWLIYIFVFLIGVETTNQLYKACGFQYNFNIISTFWSNKDGSKKFGSSLDGVPTNSHHGSQRRKTWWTKCGWWKRSTWARAVLSHDGTRLGVFHQTSDFQTMGPWSPSPSSGYSCLVHLCLGHELDQDLHLHVSPKDIIIGTDSCNPVWQKIDNSLRPIYYNHL